MFSKHRLRATVAEQRFAPVGGMVPAVMLTGSQRVNARLQSRNLGGVRITANIASRCGHRRFGLALSRAKGRMKCPHLFKENIDGEIWCTVQGMHVRRVRTAWVYTE
jgi:hypothetical protein